MAVSVPYFRCAVLLLLFTGAGARPLCAQIPLGIIEGRLLTIEKAQLTLALEGDREVFCAVDGRTFVDRERQRLALTDLKIGDFLELVTERQGPGRTCFARMIHVANGQPRFAGRHRVGQVSRVTETISPRGNVQVSGLVRDLQPQWMEVKTRQAGSFRVRLRPDTVFARDGVAVTREDLPVNQRVSVRGGYALDGELEAYQVVWGAILPRTPLP